MAYGAVQYHMWQPYVKNYRPHAARQLFPVAEVWLAK